MNSILLLAAMLANSTAGSAIAPPSVRFDPGMPAADTTMVWSDVQLKTLDEVSGWISHDSKTRYVLMAESDGQECGDIELVCEGLRQRRFEAVANYLKTHGVRSSQILWYEEQHWILPADATEDLRAKRRSVAFRATAIMHCAAITETACLQRRGGLYD
jgi:hypothetical protein